MLQSRYGRELAKEHAMTLIELLMMKHAQRLSEAQRAFQMAKREKDKLCMGYLIFLGDEAFRKCGRWANEKRRVDAYEV